MPDFNYIITVHNKENLLERVLRGVGGSASASARIIVVLDGCTDGSEAIAQRFADASPVPTLLVRAPDVHEIRSINLGLRQAQPGYCVILQDDVVLAEPDLEALVHALCEQHQRRLGYISFRLAADVRRTPPWRRMRIAWFHGPQFLFTQLAECVNEVGGPTEILDVPKVPFGQFERRMVGIKSPVCLTPELRAVAPLLDESFAPYCYDDCDLSLQGLAHGLVNGLFPIRLVTDLSWGGTRKDPNFGAAFGEQIRLRNRRRLWQKHRAFIRRYRR